MPVYLDNSATTKQYKEVTQEMLKYMEGEYFGNPSSMHRLGIIGEKGVKEARRAVAAALGAKDAEVFFTSGGTESDNIAIRGAAHALKRKGKKIITSKIEHPAVLQTCKAMEKEGFEVVYLDVDNQGFVSAEELKENIDETTVLISIMNVNNEVGSIQPIKEIGKLKEKKEKLYFHTDGVQAFGKIDLKSEIENIDLLSISAHKIHGPKGVGALYMKKGTHIISPITGGGQEGDIRSGTENVCGIAGFGKAAKQISAHLSEDQKHLSRIKEYLFAGIQTEISDIKLNGVLGSHGIPGILNVSFLGVRGEVLLHTLEERGIYVSTGSACSSNKKGQSYVLKAMGCSEKEIEGAIRFSFCAFNTIEEMDYVLYELKKAVDNIRKLVRR